MKPQELYGYEREAIMHQLNHSDSMIWMQMGLGKTIVTLTTIVDLMRAGRVRKTLIFGPLRVVQSVWAKEAKKWDHTKHLSFSIMHGKPDKRLRAMFSEADIFLTNYENMNWLAYQLDHYFIKQGKPLPFEMVVYDEISKLKNSTSMRMQGGVRDRKDGTGETVQIHKTGWRTIIPHFKFRTGLTGTPASNGYIDLHGQYLSVDGGKRLGEHVSTYRDNYFISDHMGWKYSPSELGARCIEKNISDITIKMDSIEHLDMPELNIIDMMVELPPSARKAYDEMEDQMFAELDSGVEIEVFSRNSISNKLLQFCNGSPYISTETRDYENLHDVKLDALEDVLEEAAGQPVLVGYSFVPDAERIMKRFKRKYNPVNMTKVKSAQTGATIAKWQRGEIRLMVGHPKSMGYGLDGLQDSGSILVWFGVNWSLELYDQLIARLWRQGQSRPVSVIRILCKDTVDLAVVDSINQKDSDQEGLKAALQRYRTTRGRG